MGQPDPYSAFEYFWVKPRIVKYLSKNGRDKKIWQIADRKLSEIRNLFLKVELFKKNWGEPESTKVVRSGFWPTLG